MNDLYGMYPDMKEAQQNALRANIAIYQLIWPRRARFPRKICGPYDVRVNQMDNENMRRTRPQFTVDWLTGADANISFERSNKDTAIAYMPEDPFWHNRLILMDNPQVLAMVTQLRLPTNAIKSGEEIAMETKCMQDVLKEIVPVWNVVEGNRTYGSFPSKEEAEEYIVEASTLQTKVAFDGKIVPMKKRLRKYKITETSTFEYKKSVSEMVAAGAGRYQFGWTECHEFMTKLVPEIKERIKSRQDEFKTDESKLTAGSIASALMDMSPEDKSNIIKALKEEQKKPSKRPRRTRAQIEEDEKKADEKKAEVIN